MNIETHIITKYNTQSLKLDLIGKVCLFKLYT